MVAARTLVTHLSPAWLERFWWAKDGKCALETMSQARQFEK